MTDCKECRCLPYGPPDFVDSVGFADFAGFGYSAGS